MPDKLARKNLLLYLLQYGAKFLSPIFVAPFLAKTLGPVAFADYVVWNSTVWTSVLLMEFGFYLYAITLTAASKTKVTLGSAVSSILTAKLMLAPLAIACFLLATYLLGLADRQPAAVAFGVVVVFFYGMNFGWYFQGLQRGMTVVLTEAIPQLMQLLLVLAIVRTTEQMWLVAALQTLAGIATTSFGWIYLKRNGLSLKIIWGSGVHAVKSASPYFFERASYTIYSTATPILILTLSNAHQAAFYGLAEKVNIILTAIVPAATSAFTPLVTRHMQKQPISWSLSLKIVFFVTATTFLGAIVAAFSAKPLIERFLGPEFDGAVPVAYWFCVVAPLMAFQISLSNFIILQSGRASLLIRTSSFALVTTLSIQAVLVPKYGALGAVIARACAELGIGLILLYFTLKVLTEHRQLVKRA